MTPCEVWSGRIDSEGYGRFGRGSYAHRAAWEREHGPIAEGMTVDHLCRNRACVNTAHMEIVTRGENVLRGTSPAAQNVRKTHCPRGHLYDGIKAGRYRICLRCKREQERRRYHARKAAA